MSDPQTTAELCKHDGKPCYASAGTNDAHWRCGTAQCSPAQSQTTMHYLTGDILDDRVTGSLSDGTRIKGTNKSQTSAQHDELAEIFASAETLVLGPRVLNKRRDGMPPRSVYIGRPGKWGNPFEIGRDGTRAEVIAKHRAWICEQPQLMAALPELRGHNLVCWCAPAACHGDTLKELANV